MVGPARGWLINDHLTTIPGSRTLWHHLLDWLPGLEWKGGVEFPLLPSHVENLQQPLADYIIRNGSYFRALGTMPCPTIALVQDLFVPDRAREQQVRVCSEAALVVYNSEYTRAQFPELADRPSRVIPLPVDFERFHPMPGVEKRWDVCWIGARSHVKGWDVLLRLIDQTAYSYCVVLKDESYDPAEILAPERVEVVCRATQEFLVRLINQCRVGLCTSRVETQHLAGIEMGACGLKLVAPRVGVYYDRADGEWGCCYEHEREIADSIRDVLTWSGDPRAYWRNAGMTVEICRDSWRAAVEEVTRG